MLLIESSAECRAQEQMMSQIESFLAYRRELLLFSDKISYRAYMLAKNIQLVAQRPEAKNLYTLLLQVSALHSFEVARGIRDLFINAPQVLKQQYIMSEYDTEDEEQL